MHKINGNIKGTALITAILIVAVVSITAITMQGYLRSETNRTQNTLDSDVLLNMVYDIETWGLARIKKIATNTNKNTNPDGNNDGSNTSLDISNLQVKISNYDKVQEGKIVNQQGLFNINYLYDASFCSGKESDKKINLFNKIFANLLKQAMPDHGISTEAQGMIDNIKTWMCPPKVASSDNAVDNTDPNWSYQTGHQFFVDVSELKLATNIDRKMYLKLAKYLTAFPVMGANNEIQANFDINNLSPGLLSALVNVSPDTAKDYLESIKAKSSVEKIDAIIKYATDQNIYNPEELTELRKKFVKSKGSNGNYYMIYATATKGTSIMQMQTLVYQDKSLEILWRKRGQHNG